MTFLTLCVFLMMFSLGGLCIDLMRHEMERARMQMVMDNAMLAVANLQETREPSLVISDYFAKQGLSSALSSIQATSHTGKMTTGNVDASAESDISTVFMRMSGVEKLGVQVKAGAIEAVENIEISLALDVSHSMQYGNRIDYLRPAAKDLVSTVLSGGAANSRSINLIPFAGQTNPGPVMFDMLGGVRYGTTGKNLFPTSAGAIESTVLYYQRFTSYSGEMESDDDDDIYAAPPPYDYARMTTDYPGVTLPEFNPNDLDSYIFFLDAYHRRHDSNLSDSARLVGVSFIDAAGSTSVYGMSGAVLSFDPIKDPALADATTTFKPFYDEVIGQVSSCLELNSDDFTYSALPAAGSYDQTPHFTQGVYDANTMDFGWCPEDDVQIQYAQNSATGLKTFIDAMRLHDGDGAQYAMRYGLALLDPTSSDEFAMLAKAGQVPTAFAAGPKSWTDTTVEKYIILVSDDPVSEQVRPTHKYAPDNTSTPLSLQLDFETKEKSTRDENLSAFYASCDLAKKNGITVFTIAFGASATGQAELLNCASSPSHYFEATGQDISDAFGAICRQITQLRLTN